MIADAFSIGWRFGSFHCSAILKFSNFYVLTKFEILQFLPGFIEYDCYQKHAPIFRDFMDNCSNQMRFVSFSDESQEQWTGIGRYTDKLDDREDLNKKHRGSIAPSKFLI